MNKTITIFSSSRSEGNTRKLLNVFANKVDTDVLDLSDYSFSEYDYEHRNKDDDFLPLVKKILSYETIIFASPIYWYSVTPTMKKFIDRISDLLSVLELKETGRKFRGKQAFIICTSVHEKASDIFIQALSQTFKYLGMNYKGHIHADCSDGFNISNIESALLEFEGLF